MTHPALYETGYHQLNDREHFVPEGWEDLDVGICPCGEVVVWDEATDAWLAINDQVVLILPVLAVRELLIRLHAVSSPIHDTIKRQFDLQEEIVKYTEVTG